MVFAPSVVLLIIKIPSSIWDNSICDMKINCAMVGTIVNNNGDYNPHLCTYSYASIVGHIFFSVLVTEQR